MKYSVLIFLTLMYVVLLFFIANYGNRRARNGKSLINNPVVYSLSLAVYCTVWTYYGSVGRAATTGLDYLGVYLGPTILAPLWLMMMRKVSLISKYQRVTSIADFLSSRYGKSTGIGTLVTVICLLGIIPYISIQLKGIGLSFDMLTSSFDEDNYFWDNSVFYKDKVQYVAIFLALFSILYGVRKLDPNERHEGLVTAIAFESIIKLVAFLLVGIYVCYFLYDGIEDLFLKVSYDPAIQQLFTFKDAEISSTSWIWILLISMSAIMFLPRQFHMTIVENTRSTYMRQAMWMFPLYMLMISFFVLPIAVAGLDLLRGTGIEPDSYVISIPLSNNNTYLAAFAYLGGFSAATSMVVVSVIALSIMISNNLIMPIIINYENKTEGRFTLLSERLLGIRRVIVIVILLFAYAFFRGVAKDYSLVSIGLISFVAIFQLAPVFIGGLYWKKANKAGAIAGMSTGFIIWLITLPIPFLGESQIIDHEFIAQGYFGISWLKPYALFGIEGMDTISHAAMWSISLNILLFVLISVIKSPSIVEIAQADIFLNIEKYTSDDSEIEVIKKEALVVDLQALMIRFLGEKKAIEVLQSYKKEGKELRGENARASQEYINFVERTLTGAFGSASAKVLISSVVKEQRIGTQELSDILNQTKEILEYSQAIESKSQELEIKTKDLEKANSKLLELDQLKAEFISTVTHELRTPITAIKSLSSIIHEEKNLDSQTHEKYTSIIIEECDRITRLINQVLDVEKYANRKTPLTSEPVQVSPIIEKCLAELENIEEEKNVSLNYTGQDIDVLVNINTDELKQIILNLLTNAIKFVPVIGGRITIDSYCQSNEYIISVEDNGPGIPQSFEDVLFDQFTQYATKTKGKPQGSGLGLYITKSLVERNSGRIEVGRSSKLNGASFTVIFPISTD